MMMWNTMLGMGLSAALIFMVGLREVEAQAGAEPGRKAGSNGETIFLRHCAGCHGSEGKGDGYMMLGPDPANLTGRSTTQQSDAALLKTIHEGKPNMPSWKALLSEDDSRAVLAYIRTLRGN